MGFKVVINTTFGGFAISAVAAEWMLARGADPAQVYTGEYPGCFLPRHHPLLVGAVEALGSAASGHCAKLAVGEIDQPLYRIQEYDGAESLEVPGDLEWDDASRP